MRILKKKKKDSEEKESEVSVHDLDDLISQYQLRGPLNDRQRQALLSKAAKMGLDTEEVDLYLDVQQKKAEEVQTVLKELKQTLQDCRNIGKNVSFFNVYAKIIKINSLRAQLNASFEEVKNEYPNNEVLEKRLYKIDHEVWSIRRDIVYQLERNNKIIIGIIIFIVVMLIIWGCYWIISTGQ